MTSKTASRRTGALALKSWIATNVGLPVTLLLLGCGSGIIGSTTAPSSPSAPPSNSNAIVVQSNQATVQVGQTAQFTVTQQNHTVPGGQWVVLGGSANGSIDQSGSFQAPATVPTPAMISVGYIVSTAIYTSNITITNAPSNNANSAPAITLISPSTITKLSSSIQIVGSGFLPTSIVSVNSVPTTTTYTDSTHLSAIVKLQNPLNTILSISVANPGPDPIQSSPAQLAASFPAISVQPDTLQVGNVTLTITGSGFSSGYVVFLDGKALTTSVVSSTQISATGYLKPWSSGATIVEVAAADGLSPVSAQALPIQATPVTYDAAVRFATQAAFGPRPDLVEHIQQIGFDNWLDEQFQQAPVNYTNGPRTFMTAAISGNSLLRQRVAIGLQTFIVGHDQSFDPSSTFFEQTLEADAGGNFRTLLTDITSSPNLTYFLNLMGNQASTDIRNQPNQNFAREIMQLFSLGPLLLNDDGSLQRDSMGNSIPTYGQDTVIDMTRALTGWGYPTIVNQADVAWGIDFSQPLAANDSYHDHNAKTLFGNIPLPAGQTIVQDRDAALDAIFNHPNLPPFISRLLIQRLVKSDPTPAYIQRISTVFEDDGTGVRGNLKAVIRAILLDPEARAGDTSPRADDGFLQSPLMLQLFAMNALQDAGTDDQRNYLAGKLGEGWWNSPNVFYFFDPNYKVPGSSITSPEFMLLNNISDIQRTQVMWGMVTGTIGGYDTGYQKGSWLFNNFTTVPEMVDALNHLLYHGQMSQQQQTAILNYCSQLNPFDTTLQLESAIFLALNGDAYSVSN